MSVTYELAPVHDLSPVDSPRLELLMAPPEMLKDATKSVNLEGIGVCKPDQLGLASEYGTENCRVLELFDLDDTDDTKLYAAAIVLDDPMAKTKRVFLVGLDQNADGELQHNSTWVGVHEGSETSLGRREDKVQDNSLRGAESLWPGRKFGDLISSNHVSFEVREGQLLTRDSSLNGTGINHLPPKQEQYTIPEAVEDQVEDDFGHISEHTLSAKERARLIGHLKEATPGSNELYAGREVITRDTTDPEGKVDIRSWAAGSEAIVVDSSKENSPEYTKLLDQTMEILTQKGVFTEEDVIKAIYDTVESAMEYDLAGVAEISNWATADHKKINLGAYISEGKGVCRHMALTSQWLGARMKDKYPTLLTGEFTVPVNQRTSDNAAHEWTRYTTPSGKVYIIDPAQKFVGTLEEIMLDGSKGATRWEYFANKQEKDEHEARLIGGTAIDGGRFWKRKNKK